MAEQWEMNSDCIKATTKSRSKQNQLDTKAAGIFRFH